MLLDKFLKAEGVQMTEVQKDDFMLYIKYQCNFGYKVECYQDLQNLLSGYKFQTNNMKCLFRH